MLWPQSDVNLMRAAPAFRQMTAIARHPPGQCSEQGGRPPFKITAGAEYAVAVDHHAGIAKCHVLALNRGRDRLIIDTGIGHHHTHGGQCVNRAPLKIGPAIFLL